MSAYLKLEHSLCPRCGTAEGDWMDPITRHMHDVPKWEATAMRCHGCAALAAEEKRVPSGEQGVRVVLVPFRDDEDDGEDDGGW